METIWKTIFFISLTLTMYWLMTCVYRRFHYAIFIPAVTCTIILVTILINFEIPYAQYMIGGRWINELLGPAVVALAYPLFKQRKLLFKYWNVIISSTLGGLIFGMLSGSLIATIWGFSPVYLLSMVPKSITTPVAIQISSNLGGDPALTSIFVMIAGFTGAIFAPMIFKVFRLNSNMGKGIGLGTSSHAMGTAVAMEFGEEAFSMSSIAMTVSAVLGSILGPVVALLF